MHPPLLSYQALGRAQYQNPLQFWCRQICPSQVQALVAGEHTHTEETKSFVQRVRTAARRKYTAEEKIRTVLEGFRREVAVNELCRREGTKPHSYYSWTREFMEAGEERLAYDAVRDAAQREVHRLRRESVELKQLVADLSPEGYGLQERPFRYPAPPVPTYSAVEKAEVLVKAASSGLLKWLRRGRTNKDLRTRQEAPSPHGAVLLAGSPLPSVGTQGLSIIRE